MKHNNFISNIITALKSKPHENALASESSGNQWKKLTNRSKELFSAATLIKIVFAQVRQAISTTIDLDKVYTDLIKINNELNRNNYAEYLSECSQKAKELATTQQALIENVTAFSKAGYDLKTSNALAEKSTILANVGDMSESDSAKAIISGVQSYDNVDGYTESVDKAQALIDKFIKIGSTAGITTAEIAEGVHSVGTVFSDTNTSVDEFIALLAAGNQQYQDADALALGLQNTALRIRSCTTELEAMGEETDTVMASAAELAEQIKSLTNIDGNGGVEILDTQGEFRSIYDIFLDISKVYSQMSATDSNALLELIAGKNHASSISAVLNNMSAAQEILQDSLGAAGTAQKEYDAYLQSTQAHIAQFQATLVETYSTFMNGDMISHTADMGTAVLNLVNHTDLLKHSILAVLALNVGKGITTIGGTIASTTRQMHMLGNALQQVKSLPTDDDSREKSLKGIGEATKNLTEKNLKLLLSQQQLEDNDRIAILKQQELTEAEALAKLEKMGLTTATNAQSAANVTETVTTTTLKGAMESLKLSVAGMLTSFKAMIAANPIGFFLTVTTTAISIATSAISKHKQKVEQAQEKAKEAANTANTLSTEISELTNKYISLSEAVKTDASVKDDLMSTQGELIKKLGLEGESVDSLIEKYGSLDNAIKQASLEQLGEAENDLIAGVDAAEQELLDVGKDNWFGTKNSIAATGKDAGKAWQVLDDAGIISSGSHTDKGGEWFLEGDDTTVEGILDNYQKLQDAMAALRESGEFTSKELSANPVWKEIYNRASEMKEAVETYNSSIQNLNANLAEQMMLKSLKGRDLPNTEEEFNTFRQELINTAISSNEFIGSEKDIEQAINDYLSTVSEFEGYYSIPLEKELNKMKDLVSHANTDLSSPITSSIEQISSLLEPQFTKLGEAYRNIFTEDSYTTENIDTSMLEGLRETFAEMESVTGTAFDTDELESFFAVLTSGTSDIEKMQKAFDDLASSYLDSTGILENLSEANADVVKTQLESLGVSNAQDIVNASLMQSENALANAQEEVTRLKGEDYAASIDLENATAGELQALYNEANMCGLASGGLASLLAQKYNVNNLSIASAADCNALAEIYAWSETTAASLKNLAAAKQRAESGQYVPEEELKGKEKLAKDNVENAQSTPKINTPPTVKTPSINIGGGPASKSTFSETFDWIERRIKRLQSKFDKWIDRFGTLQPSRKTLIISMLI